MSRPIKQWYAMRKRLQDTGKWSGGAPSHKVPAREEGEPPEKESRTEAQHPEGGDDPEEGTSARARGKHILTLYIFQIGNGGLWRINWILYPIMVRSRLLEIRRSGSRATRF